MTFIDFTGKAIPPRAEQPSNDQIIKAVQDGPAAPLQEDKPVKDVAVSRNTLHESAVIGEPTGVGTITPAVKSVKVPAFGGMNSWGPALLDKEDNRPHSGSTQAPIGTEQAGAGGNFL